VKIFPKAGRVVVARRVGGSKRLEHLQCSFVFTVEMGCVYVQTGRVRKG